MARRIHITGIRRSEIDTDLLAFVYFQQGKRLVQQRREREAADKGKRHEREASKGGSSGGQR
jgi:uncharacterized protein YdaU (DUF1376 family)